MCIQWEVGITGDGELVHRQGVEQLGSLDLCWNRSSTPDFGQAVGDEKDEDDQRSVCWTFDFKVPEQRVGTEEVQSFIDDICLRRIANGSWTPYSRSDWQDTHIAHLPDIGLFIER